MTEPQKDTKSDEPITPAGMLKVAAAGLAIVIFSPIIAGMALVGWVANKRESKDKPKPRSARVVKILG